jgi:hypothetical protein
LGLNVAGLHVQAGPTLSQRDVADAVAAYWTGLGAVPTESDPLDFDRLALDKTGQLGFLVLPKLDGEGDHSWIGVYDSERYTADRALAHHLARTLHTRVWFWQLADASGQAWAQRYGDDEQSVRGEAVEALLEGLPGTHLYYDKVRDLLPPEALEAVLVLGFEQIPHRPNAEYSGPSPEQLARAERLLQASALAEAWQSEGLAELGRDPGVWSGVLKARIRSADLHDPDQRSFVLALADTILEHSKHAPELAEAALRQGDEGLFERALGDMASFQTTLLETRALSVGQQGEPELAYRLYEALTRSPAAGLTPWVNALYFAEVAGVQAGARLDSLWTRAAAAAPVHPLIFHNLASIAMSQGRPERVFEAIRGAAVFGYTGLQLIRDDPDFAPLADDPRFGEALAAEPTAAVDHLVIHRRHRGADVRLVAPAIGLQLTFRSGDAAPALAELMGRVAADFPEMFTFYRPSGVLGMSPTKRGKAARDATSLRKNKSRYGFEIQYDNAEGQATDQRFYLELKGEGGELSLHLPLSLADEPDALVERLVGYAQLVPFSWGQAGFTLSPFECGNLVGAPTDAHDAALALLADRLGLVASPSQLGEYPNAYAVNPGWLTFVGHHLLPRLAPQWRQAVQPAQVVDLECGVMVRASRGPRVGVRVRPNLGALPAVARALLPLKVVGTGPLGLRENERIDFLAGLAPS